jgi:hypothetical protein
MAFKISEKFTNENWNELALTDDNSPEWATGIAIINDRFNSRFFNQIDKIKSNEFSGFAVLALDCLLIETLMQFYLGADNTEINYRRKQWKAFNDFFRHSKYFKTEFNTDLIRKTFYDHFRCGLLHQAQTKEKSLIRIFEPSVVSIFDTTDISKGLIIDRDLFHNKLTLEFNGYIKGLEDNENNFKSQNLRIKAISKMNVICAG